MSDGIEVSKKSIADPKYDRFNPHPEYTSLLNSIRNHKSGNSKRYQENYDKIDWSSDLSDFGKEEPEPEPEITYVELCEFFGSDTPDDIARYLSSNMTMLLRGQITVERFVDMHRPETDND